MKRAWKGYLLIAPMLAGFLLFYVVPFGQVVWDSLSQGTGKSQLFVGLENYTRMFQNDMFLQAFGNTLRFLGIGLPVILVLAYALALFLKSQAQRFRMLRAVFLLPYVMPVAGTVLLVDLLFSKEGLVNRVLLALGLPLADWLQSPAAFWVMLLLYLWKSTGYAVVLLLSGLLTIPQEHYQVAQVEGASPLQTFRYVTAPQMWYALFLALVFSLINAFKCFREIFLVGGEHPHESVYMLQHFINNAFANLNYQRLSVASVLLFLVIALVLGLCTLWVLRNEAARL
ncbi:MAG: carbohydrate ABC transporter permease [Acutalibacter sp.]